MANLEPTFAYRKPKPGDRWRAREVLTFLKLPDCAKRVGWKLVDRNRHGQCDPGGARIAWDSRLGKAATWKGIKALCDAGLIVRKQDGRAYGNLMTAADWRRNSYEINWPKFNELHAELIAHRKAYRRGVTEALPPVTVKNVSTSVDMTEGDMSTSAHMTASTSVDTNLGSRTPVKEKNRESPCGAIADCSGHDSLPPGWTVRHGRIITDDGIKVPEVDEIGDAKQRAALRRYQRFVEENELAK